MVNSIIFDLSGSWLFAGRPPLDACVEEVGDGPGVRHGMGKAEHVAGTVKNHLGGIRDALDQLSGGRFANQPVVGRGDYQGGHVDVAQAATVVGREGGLRPRHIAAPRGVLDEEPPEILLAARHLPLTVVGGCQGSGVEAQGDLAVERIGQEPGAGHLGPYQRGVNRVSSEAPRQHEAAQTSWPSDCNPQADDGAEAVAHQDVVVNAGHLRLDEVGVGLDVVDRFGEPHGAQRPVGQGSELLQAPRGAREAGDCHDGRTAHTSPRGWERHLADHMRRLRQVVLRHPALGAVLAARGLRTPSVFRLLEAGLGLLRSAGFDRRTTAEIYYALLTYTLGFLAWEIPRMHRQPEGAYTQQWQDGLATLPAAQYPTLHELAQELPNVASERQFEAGLNALLRGFKARERG